MIFLFLAGAAASTSCFTARAKFHAPINSRLIFYHIYRVAWFTRFEVSGRYLAFPTMPSPLPLLADIIAITFRFHLSARVIGFAAFIEREGHLCPLAA